MCSPSHSHSRWTTVGAAQARLRRNAHLVVDTRGRKSWPAFGVHSEVQGIGRRDAWPYLLKEYSVPERSDAGCSLFKASSNQRGSTKRADGVGRLKRCETSELLPLVPPPPL